MSNKKDAFWLYVALIESILPLDYFKNSLYPQTLHDFSFKCLKDKDKSFLDLFTDSVKMFGMQSFYGLFTNLQMNLSEFNISNSYNETAYFMLDILLLLGDPTQSKTMHDDYSIDGEFIVGGFVPEKFISLNPSPEDWINEKVRIDRTS